MQCVNRGRKCNILSWVATYDHLEWAGKRESNVDDGLVMRRVERSKIEYSTRPLYTGRQPVYHPWHKLIIPHFFLLLTLRCPFYPPILLSCPSPLQVSLYSTNNHVVHLLHRYGFQYGSVVNSYWKIYRSISACSVSKFIQEFQTFRNVGRISVNENSLAMDIHLHVRLRNRATSKSRKGIC